MKAKDHTEKKIDDLIENQSCSFSKILNKKWQNIQQTKLVFNSNRNTMSFIYKNNNASNFHDSYIEDSIYLKLNCIKIFQQKPSTINNETIYIVSNLLEWSDMLT